jgi:carbonic anhydrase
VLAGIVMLRRAVRARVRVVEPDGAAPWRVIVEGTLSFLSVPALSRTLAAVPAGAPVRVELVVDYLDHAAYDHLHAWTARRRAHGAEVVVTEPERRARGDRPRHGYATWSGWRG